MNERDGLGVLGAAGISVFIVGFACSSSGGNDDGVTGGSAGNTSSGPGNAGNSSAGASSSAGGTQNGSGGSDSGVGGDDPGSGGSITCDNADAVAAAFVGGNQTCRIATDCVEVNAGCYSQQQDCCVVYLNRDYDQAAWTELISLLDSCSGPCGCCAAIPAPPDCIAGQCGPDRG